MKAEQIMQVLRAIIEADKADGCRLCAYEGVKEWEMPCVKCRRNCKDYWRPKGRQEIGTEDKEDD